MVALVLNKPGNITVRHGTVARIFENATIFETHPYDNDETRYEIWGTELVERVNPNGDPRTEEVEVVVGLNPENLITFEEI